MAFQLGSLGTIQKPELVSNNRARSGNYRDFLSNTKKKRMDFEDREKLNALGNARSEAILDSQGGSEVIQGLRKKQQDALANKDSAMYDQATNELKSQMQIESAEAKADPFGKNQLGRDRLAQSQKKGRELPLIEQAVRDQTSAKENALNILDEYFNFEGDKTKEVKSEFRQRYMDEWRKQKDAMATLSRYSDSSSHNFQKLDEWKKAVSGGIKERSAEKVSNAMVRKLMADADMTELEAEHALADRDKKDKKDAQDLNFAQQDQAMKSKKFKEESKARSNERVRKALSDQKLSHPDVYKGYMEDAKTAYELNNIYAMVKLLANTIEPGMNVADTEVKGYLQGGENRLSKVLFSVVGAGEKDKDKLLGLINGMGKNRMDRAQSILDGNSDKPIKKKESSKKEPEKILNFDPATGTFS